MSVYPTQGFGFLCAVLCVDQVVQIVLVNVQLHEPAGFTVHERLASMQKKKQFEHVFNNRGDAKKFRCHTSDTNHQRTFTAAMQHSTMNLLMNFACRASSQMHNTLIGLN